MTVGPWLIRNSGEDSFGPDAEDRSAAAVRYMRRSARIATQAGRLSVSRRYTQFLVPMLQEL